MVYQIARWMRPSRPPTRGRLAKVSVGAGANRVLTIMGGAAALLALRCVVRFVRGSWPGSLREKVVLIAGGSRGLGFVLARECGRRGARVAICARDRHELEEAKRRLAQEGIEAYALTCDLSRRAQVGRMVETVMEHFGRVDVLVNNASVIAAGPLLDQRVEDFEQVMAVNFFSGLYATMALLPHMLAREEGRIVNITSIGGKIAVPHLLTYSSAKFAAVGLSEGMRAELARYGIRVTTVAPGLMRTGSYLNTLIQGNRQAEFTWFALLDSLPLVTSMSARRAARQIVRATVRGDAEIVLTWQARVAALLHGVFPGLMTDILALVNRALPGPTGPGGEARASGAASQGPITRSFLTGLSQRAAEANNELSATPDQLDAELAQGVDEPVRPL
jgi:NAD(P)-dependent dehydrogenase (short-subunit alcohol dehydrogenase family)